MIKKILMSILFIAIVFMVFLGINRLNSDTRKNKLIDEITPIEFVANIKKYEDEVLKNPDIIIDNLEHNIYRHYNLNTTTFGFIVGTMGYEEEMLVYVELEYLKESIKVNQVQVLYENETDGYGDFVVESWFLDRFKQVLTKDLSLVRRKKTDKNQIIAITGATITSDAIVSAVNECRKIMEDSRNEN